MQPGNIEDYLLWDTVIDRCPLNFLVIFLPTQVPEWSSISWHATSILLGMAWLAHAILVPLFTKMIKALDAMSYKTILKGHVRCGY
jgi:hypothetical protein